VDTLHTTNGVVIRPADEETARQLVSTP